MKTGAVIEILAIETSGVDASDHVIEMCLGRAVIGGSFSYETQIVRPPEDYDFSPEIISYHQKTGLLTELAAAKEEPIVIPFEACNMRVVWALEFAKKMLPQHASILQAAHGTESLYAFARAAHGVDLPRPNRAAAKVKQIAGVLALLSQG